MANDHVCTSGKLEINRRSLLLGMGAALAAGRPSLALAAGTSSARLVVLNLRGGLDGLSLVAPYGDPNLAPLRGQIMAPAVGKAGGMFDLGGFYGLHPAMPNLYAMYQAGEAAFVHAVGNIALTRSHFDGQDYLQSGAPELLTSGWLNRVMGMVPGVSGMQSGISLADCEPLIAQGPAIAAGWAPDCFPEAGSQFISNLTNLLAADSLLGPAYAAGYADRTSFNSLLQAAPMASNLTPFQQLAWAAGDFLAAPQGPRIATIQSDSFDTHADQVSRLNTGLQELDGALLLLKQSLGSVWSNTVIMTITEFGRTAYANGDSTCGTDHGTAFAVILAGGAVSGGKVVANWPGLSASQLYQGRDLAPTTDVRAIAMGVLEAHLGLSAKSMKTVFPGVDVAPLTGLVTA
jgi:uncharacterized protein (DUF1501 family)